MIGMRHQYYIVYEKDGRGYLASVPAIPGCIVFGKTIKEAYQNIIIAIEECLEVRNEFQKQPPNEPMKPEEVRRFSFADIPAYAKA